MPAAPGTRTANFVEPTVLISHLFDASCFLVVHNTHDCLPFPLPPTWTCLTLATLSECFPAWTCLRISIWSSNRRRRRWQRRRCFWNSSPESYHSQLVIDWRGAARAGRHCSWNDGEQPGHRRQGCHANGMSGDPSHMAHRRPCNTVRSHRTYERAVVVVVFYSHMNSSTPSSSWSQYRLQQHSRVGAKFRGNYWRERTYTGRR